MDSEIYSPRYSESRALVVGINNYQHASPLSYAIRDSEETARVLIDEFGFIEKNIILLSAL